MIALFIKRLFSRKGNIRMNPDNEQVEEQANDEVTDVTPPAEGRASRPSGGRGSAARRPARRRYAGSARYVD